MFISFLAYKLAPYIGHPEKDDIEKKKLPASLNILQDNIIATALVMFISVAIIMLVVGSKNIDWLRGADGLAQAGLKNNIVILILDHNYIDSQHLCIISRCSYVCW